MESTISAQTITAAQVALLSIVSQWSTIIGAFSSIFLSVSFIVLAILGFLTWRQDQLRRLAEKELQRILEISKKVDQSHKIMNAQVQSIQRSSYGVAKMAIEAGNILSTKTRLAEEGVSKIRALHEGIKKESASSLATISRMSPYYGVTVAETPLPLREKSLSESLEEMGRERQKRSALEEVLEAVKRSKSPENFNDVLREARRLNQEKSEKVR